jgi:hypothetical protein
MLFFDNMAKVHVIIELNAINFAKQLSKQFLNVFLTLNFMYYTENIVSNNACKNGKIK